MTADKTLISPLLQQIYQKLSDDAQDLEKGKIKLRQLMHKVVDDKKMQKVLKYIDNINN